MENVFYGHDISQVESILSDYHDKVYDLKGTLRNRLAQPRDDKHEVLLDENLIRCKHIYQCNSFIK